MPNDVVLNKVQIIHRCRNRFGDFAKLVLKMND
jgi:hypothetical protein